MHKKDYLQRQLEEFGKVLAMILGLKKEKDWDRFENELRQAAQRFTPLELENVENCSEEDFETDVVLRKDLSLEQKKILASLLFEKLNLYMAAMDTVNYEKLKQRCLKLYLYLKENHSNNEFDLDVHYKIGVLTSL